MRAWSSSEGDCHLQTATDHGPAIEMLANLWQCGSGCLSLGRMQSTACMPMSLPVLTDGTHCFEPSSALRDQLLPLASCDKRRRSDRSGQCAKVALATLCHGSYYQPSSSPRALRRAYYTAHCSRSSLQHGRKFCTGSGRCVYFCMCIFYNVSRSWTRIIELQTKDARSR